MFDFAYPKHLLALIAVAAIALLYCWAEDSSRKRLRKFGNPAVLAPLMPDASKYMPRVKAALRLLALVAIAMILARPRAGETVPQQSRSEGIEIMIAFDVSKSMLASASDNPSGMSRLDQARLLLEKLINKLHNDKVGLIVFAGEAKTQMPLTTDYFTAKMYLNDLSTDLVNYQGTSITDAINMSIKSFSPNDSIHKAIILITDAENHEGNAIEAAKAAAQAGVQVDVVGVGTPKGGPIPLGDGEYMLDNEGNVVVTTFDEQAAEQIAKAGNGVYVNGASSKALDDLASTLDNLDKTTFKNVKYKASAEQFPTFAWLALILLVVDCFVVDRKISWLKGINFFTK